MSYELSGKLVAKFDTVQRTETFKVREFAVEKTEEVGARTITNYVKFQCVQEKTFLLDSFNPGDEIKVYFNIKGTRWEKDGKVNFFTNLDAYRIEPLKPVKSTGSSIDSEYTEPLDTFSSADPENISDLPF